MLTDPSIGLCQPTTTYKFGEGWTATPFPFKMTTICFVGPSAYTAIHSALTLFPDEFRARVAPSPRRKTIPVTAGAPE